MTPRTMLLAGAALLAGAGMAAADTSDKRIALSNNYAGNSWRQAMLTSWDKVTGPAVEAGIVAAADAFTTAENQATEQAAQIQNMILQGYDAIVINAASPTALNGAVNEACDAGITVVSFDGIVTEPCAWRIAVDFKQMGKDQIAYLAERMPDTLGRPFENTVDVVNAYSAIAGPDRKQSRSIIESQQLGYPSHVSHR